MLQILRYNLPMYLAALAGCLAVALAIALLPLPRPLAALAALGAAMGLLWSVSSLLASHYIYDRSPLSAWSWLSGLLPAPPRRWASLHAGLDETFGELERLFPNGGTTLDVYDPREMTEPSIERARRLAPTRAVVPATVADFRSLPFEDSSLDAVFLIFAAHELRRPESRLLFFREIARSLAPGGRVVLVEHLRDARNFLVFGPGFVHFLARREWLRLARESGLAVRQESRITPFVAVLVLERPV
jgi:SAM-dependent methyltransferase